MENIIDNLGITPGPWERILTSDKSPAVRAERGILFKFWKPTKWPDQWERFEIETKESISNAQLVHAAPEMLEALIAMTLRHEETDIGNYGELDIAIEAIEKATGKTWPEIKELIK